MKKSSGVRWMAAGWALLAVLFWVQPGVAESAKPVDGSGAGGKKGRACHRRVFSEWHPANAVPAAKGGTLEKELRDLVAAGRRDRAASPDFLDALERLLERHAGKAAEKPSSRLPLTPDFSGPGCPAGWETVDGSAWRFGGGAAEQTRAKADTRVALSYGPGKKWRDYSVTFRCESSAWASAPAGAAAVLYFRCRGVDDTYSLWLDGAGDIALISNDKTVQQRLLARVPVPAGIIRDGKPWTVKAEGEAMEVWHEGVRWLQATDRAHPSGTVGFESMGVPMKFSGVSVNREGVLRGAKSGADEPADDMGRLLHRWSFSGDFTDSAGNATGMYFGRSACAWRADGRAVSLAGGNYGQSAVCLGRDVVPADNTPFTIEIWATQREPRRQGRIFEATTSMGSSYNANMMAMSWSWDTDISKEQVWAWKAGTDHSYVQGTASFWEDGAMAPYSLGVEYHISAVVEPDKLGDGRTFFHFAKRDAATGNILAETSGFARDGWAPSLLAGAELWLGRSTFPNDNDAAADYDEVRIWKGALSDEQLSENARSGPDELPYADKMD